MINTKLIRSGVGLLLCSPLFAGCLLTVGSGDDVDADTGDDDGSVSDTDAPSNTSVSSAGDSDDPDSSSGMADSSSDDGSVGDTTDGPTGECSTSYILDGGFEAGTPSTVWTEASEQFGTPICDTGCTEEEGAAPYAGDWFAWFGGVADPEHASVSQSITVDGASAFLSFRFEINASAGTGDDVFTVTIDGQSVFVATDLEIDDYAGYTAVSIDVSDFAGEGEHVVEFASDHPGTGMSSFFIDEVALVTCDDEGSDSSSSDDSGSSDGSETTAADGSSSDSSSDDGGSESSSDDGGSSSSTGM